MVTAGHLCNRNVVVAEPKEELKEVARRLHDADAHCVVAIDSLSDVRPLGVVSDRDMLVGVFARGDGQAAALTVGDVMSLDLVVAHEDEPAMDALMRMQRFGIRRMPVVDEQGTLVGLLALDDLIDFLSNEVKFLNGLVEELRGKRMPRYAWQGFRVVDGLGSSLD
jgi:CBS domain-containing protein